MGSTRPRPESCRPPSRRWFHWGPAVLLVIFLSASSFAAQAATSQRASIRVKACPSTYGSTGRHPVARVLRPDASVPRGYVFYANQALAVLAPAGWKCKGAVGVDGSGYVTVTAPGGRAIESSEGSVCASCNFEIACPLFPQARALQPWIGCPSTPPSDERIYKLSKIAIAFEDPPYVRGTGQPSGGRNPANGIVIYSPGPPDQALEETCTLPNAAHRDCASVLNDFLARYTARL